MTQPNENQGIDRKLKIKLLAGLIPFFLLAVTIVWMEWHTATTDGTYTRKGGFIGPFFAFSTLAVILVLLLPKGDSPGRLHRFFGLVVGCVAATSVVLALVAPFLNLYLLSHAHYHPAPRAGDGDLERYRKENGLDDAGLPKDAGNEKTRTPPADGSAAHEQNRIAKFNAVLAALEDVGTSMEQGFNHYQETVHFTEGSKGNDSPGASWGHIGIGGGARYKPAIEQLKSVLDENPGSEPLDQLARRFAQTALAIIPLLDQAGRYYGDEDYKDDGYAKGRQMHGPLVAAYGDLQRATEDLRAEVRRFGEAARDKLMTKLKAEGRMLRYSVMLSIKQARQTLEFIRGEWDAKLGVSKIDKEELKLKNDAMDENLQGIRQLMQSDPATTLREYGDVGKTYLDLYVSASDDFLLRMKNVQRAIRDNRRLSESDFNVGSGGPGDIVERFNDLVHRANSLNL